MATLRFVRPLIVALLGACAACRSDSQGRVADAFDVGAGDAGDAAPRVIARAPVEPRFQPALEALDAAVRAGDDRTARAVLARLLALEPDGGALEMATAYARILDGRDAVRALEFALDARYDRGPDKTDKAGKAGKVGIDFTARSRDGRSFDVRPGPGTLRVRITSIDERGDESRSVESVPIDTIGALPVSQGEPSRIPLSELPFARIRGALATRVLFDLELRSGSVRPSDEPDAGSGGEARDLPAMRLAVEGAEVTLLAGELASLPLAGADELAALVAGGTCDRRAALRVAVRVPRSERAAALDRLARDHDTIPEPALVALAPALRWLAPDENLGEDAGAWRSFLRTRARRSEPRDDLRLPRARVATGG